MRCLGQGKVAHELRNGPIHLIASRWFHRSFSHDVRRAAPLVVDRTSRPDATSPTGVHGLWSPLARRSDRVRARLAELGSASTTGMQTQMRPPFLVRRPEYGRPTGI
jgi:hypothetical protein